MKLHIPRCVTVLTWFYCLLIGLVTGIVAFLIGTGVAFFFKFVWGHFIEGIFSNGSNLYWESFKFIGFNLAMVLVGAALVLTVAPVAAGSGIPNMYAYLNGVDIPEFLTLSTAVAKVPASVLVVAGGLTIGKEGPLLHIGSIIATLFGNTTLFKRMEKVKDKEPFTHEQHTRDLVLCGAAAGLAAGFKAPIGGVLFAMEMATRWRPELTWRCLFTTGVTATVIRSSTYISNKRCNGSDCGFLSYGSLLFFKVEFSLPYTQIWLMIILGILGGLLGSLYTTINTMIVGSKRWRYRTKWWARLLDVGLVSIVTSLLRLGLPWMGSCLEKPPGEMSTGPRAPGVEELQNFIVYHCKKDSYNDLAVLLFNPQGYVAKILFTAKVHEFTGLSLLIFTAFYYLMATVAYGGPIPAGLFTPSLLTGAAFGQLFAWCVHQMLGMELDMGLYAFLGAAAVLGGMFRFAVSFCVVLVELLDSDPQIPFLILVLVFAKGVGDRINQNILNHLCILLGLPYLGGHPDSTIRRKGFKAMDIVNANVQKLEVLETRSKLENALASDEYGVFPVVQNRFVGRGPHLTESFIGMVSSDDLEELLNKMDRIDDLELGTGLLDADLQVDLAPIVQFPPVVIPPNMPLTSVFRLKNASSLEYLPVVETHGPLKGLISRHELVEAQNKLVDPHNLQQRLDMLTKQPFLQRTATVVSNYADMSTPLLADVGLGRAASIRKSLLRSGHVF